MNKYVKTAVITARGQLNSGVVYLLPGIFIRMLTLITLTFLWRVIMSAGANVGMSLGQMLTYAYASALLTDMLAVNTPAGSWLSEGSLQTIYGRPMTLFGQLAAQTVGGWIPGLLFFSLPMALFSPVIGVSLIPMSPLFLFSLLLCVLLGFALDFLFACLSIKLRNMSWMIGRIRTAIMAMFSGTVIPIKLLPFGLAAVMQYQPFASLGGSVLSVMVGSADTAKVLMLQVIWNLILWPLALFTFHKSQEGLVSYGG